MKATMKRLLQRVVEQGRDRLSLADRVNVFNDLCEQERVIKALEDQVGISSKDDLQVLGRRFPLGPAR